MEIKDIAPFLSGVAAIVSAIASLIQVIKKRGIITKNLIFWLSIGLTIIFAGSTAWLLTRPCVDSSKYGFEVDTMGWTPQTNGPDKGVVSAEQSGDQAKSCHSLKVIVDLEGGHPNRSKGEIFVEIPPQNLENKPITVWVYIPEEALGNPEIPNGVQVFAKDKEWRSEYGTWWNIDPADVDNWQQITLIPSKLEPPSGYMDPQFDPTQIRAVGVKIAVGDGSTARYRGPIYIDGVNWP